jgi:aspartate 1-decarboxylase
MPAECEVKKYSDRGVMLIKALKARIDRATVTGVSADCSGSIAVDSDLLEAVGIRPYEAVLLANITNGSRAETDVINAPAGSGRIDISGATAKLFSPGDMITIINFAYYHTEEMDSCKPKVIAVDKNNKIVKHI